MFMYGSEINYKILSVDFTKGFGFVDKVFFPGVFHLDGDFIPFSFLFVEPRLFVVAAK